MIRSRLRALIGAACLLASSAALAEPTSTQRAAAEALFQQASALMDDQRYAEACEKFAGSQELDPALGTMLYLADCYDRAGRSASAWGLFREAAEAAKHAGQAEREQIATERAASLEQRLSKLELKVAAARRVAGLELRLNDVLVPSASWNAPLPVDPGPMTIEARAPGKRPWRAQLKIAEGPANQVVEVAALTDAPRPVVSHSPADVPLSPGSSQRSIGYVMGAVGILALAAGGVFGYRAYSQNKQSKGQCRAEEPNSCTADGVGLREDAKTSAALSTIATVGGGALVVSGLTLVVTAPSTPAQRDTAPRSARLALPVVGLAWEGTW